MKRYRLNERGVFLVAVGLFPIVIGVIYGSLILVAVMGGKI